MELKWFTVYTKPQCEKKVVEILTRRGINNYCPLNKEITQRHDRYKIVMKPLFNSYVFVNVFEKQLDELRKIDGIISAVHWLGQPAVIKESEIEAIKLFLQEYNNVRLEKVVVSGSDNVRFCNGSLALNDGCVVEVSNNLVKVLLPSLGYVMQAQVHYVNVQEKLIAKEGY